MPTVATKTVSELAGMNFFIPSYQRGYRWGPVQVGQLLDDLWDAYQVSSKGGASRYCLQPLVVVKKETGTSGTEETHPVALCGLSAALPSVSNKEEEWTVIDGQQRLTTLLLILKQLEGESPWTIEYETRAGSKDFLEKVVPTVENAESKTNPDYWHIQRAVDTFSDWVHKHPQLKETKAKCEFAQSIRGKAMFIWYEATENPYDVFARLNSGKISLSNAELVKALLLQESCFQEKGGPVKLQQLEIAGEWDRIEQALHDDEFWFFINPAPKSPRFNATRIDFLFELVLRKGFPGQTGEPNYIDKINKNPYFGYVEFTEFYKRNATEPETIIWSEIQSVFRRIKSWYDDRSLYHYVGFLMNRKGAGEEVRFGKLVELLRKVSNTLHSEFLSDVKKRCGEAIEGKKLNELEYGQKDNDALNDVLLLFNLALLDRQSSEQSRYPFHLHVQKKWSIEHIHAQKERKMDENEIKRLMRIYSITPEIPDAIALLNEKMRADTGMEINVQDDGARKLVFSSLPSGNQSDTSGASEEILSGDDMLNSLKNLALLGGEENSALNNKLYLEKKDMLAQWERSKESHFIPIGTRMIFFKHFSPKSTLPFAWTVPDGDVYVDTLVGLVADYTRV
jgi:Uncharacterized conserved protein